MSAKFVCKTNVKMIAWTKRLTAVQGLIGSRYKSLYSRLSIKEHDNLVGLAHQLYTQNRDKYPEFQPFANPDFDRDNQKKQVKDWQEIHETAIKFGSPELSDHMSGYSKMFI